MSDTFGIFGKCPVCERTSVTIDQKGAWCTYCGWRVARQQVSNRKRPKKDPPRRPYKIRKWQESDLAEEPTIYRYNGYKCRECGGAWLTVDLNEGVTPFTTPCFATENCGGVAYSMGYPTSEPPKDLPLLIEWYKPVTTRGLSLELAEHVQKGGLLRRARKDAPEWVKALV
jgi:DNA-directed RNA polymerase subunit RPC12/RpoP